MNILEAQNVTKTFEHHIALNNLSLSVPKGSIYGLLGPNGAGKTTFIRIINQITGPDSGTVRINNRPIQADDVYNIGYLPEERGLYKKMKVGEQALYLAQLKGLSITEAKKRLKHWFEKFEIQGWWNKKVEELSKGMAQKIQFIVTVIHEPELLIFDEPFTGFDPINTQLIKEEIINLNEKGATIIFSTHRMESVEEICNHIALINKSEKILEGGLKDIQHQFKSNTFKIGLKTALSDLKVDGFDILKVQRNHDLLEHTIQLPEGSSPNTLIEAYSKVSDIYLLEEIIPTVNDIFIQSVQNQNTSDAHE